MSEPEPKEKFFNELYSLRNVFLPDGSWAGMFIDADTAKTWLTAQGYVTAECEISTRKVTPAPKK
jgi:formylmethanofuran dehydrogenase subunit D